jgi:sulfide dehydrogenase cytochrome subunit
MGGALRSAIATMAVLMFAAVLPAQAEEAAGLMAETCAACHSPHSHSTIPSLDGRPAAELLRGLLAFRDGTRPATIMDRIARGYSREQLGALAGELARRNAGERP